MIKVVKNGDIFSNWIIVDDTIVKREKRYYVKCKCTKCMITEKFVDKNSLLSLRTTMCSSCSRRQTRNPKYKNQTSVESKYYSNVRTRANRKGIPFNITIAEMFSILKKQNYKCNISGLDINFHNEISTKTASLDRIKSQKGYLKNNIQWVHKDINRMKSDFSQEYFLSLIKQIAKNGNFGLCNRD